MGFILSKYTNAPYTGIYTIGQGEIDDAKFAPEID